MTMKQLIVVGLFASLGLVTAQGAQAADNWCLRNFGDSPGKGCVSAPLEYCLRGLAAGGGVCARDRGYVEQSDDRDRAQRPARRAGKGRWDW
jgi:hypothetical protein